MKIFWWLTGLIKKNKASGRDRLMSVTVTVPMPDWCRWLTEETLKSLHDYCWVNNISPDSLEKYTDEQWREIAGKRIGQEIIDAVRGTRMMEQKEHERIARAEQKEKEEQEALAAKKAEQQKK